MNKSKIRVIFEYEFHCGTNAAQTTRSLNEVFGKDVANEHTDGLRSSDLVILIFKMNHMGNLRAKWIMMS